MSRAFVCTCSECGRDYTATFDSGNLYFCPECEAERKKRISKAFDEMSKGIDALREAKR